MNLGDGVPGPFWQHKKVDLGDGVPGPFWDSKKDVPKNTPFLNV